MTKGKPSGYTPCACRDCMEVAIGVSGEAYCHECEEAGCADYQGVRGLPQECQVERFDEDEDEDEDEEESDV